MSRLHDWTLPEEERRKLRKRLQKFEDEETRNFPSPQEGSDRACLCKDGNYSKDCCTGALGAQAL